MPRNPFFAPDRECNASDPHPIIEFTNPKDGDTVTQSPLPISGVIDVQNGSFTSWRLEYGNGADPSEWAVLVEGNNSFPQPGLIYTWDLTGINTDKVTLRIYLMNGEDYHAEKRITLSLSLPTPTPMPTLSPTPFPTETLTPVIVTPTETLTPFPPTETASPTP
jgi:hypothetical protein